MLFFKKNKAVVENKFREKVAGNGVYHMKVNVIQAY